jgi:hypothetical protein
MADVEGPRIDDICVPISSLQAANAEPKQAFCGPKTVDTDGAYDENSGRKIFLPVRRSMSDYREILKRSPSPGEMSSGIYQDMYCGMLNTSFYDYSLNNLANNVMFVDTEKLQAEETAVLGDISTIVVKGVPKTGLINVSGSKVRTSGAVKVMSAAVIPSRGPQDGAKTVNLLCGGPCNGRPPTMSGYLRVEGSIVKSWKKRYFLLKDGTLHTFSSEVECEQITGVQYDSVNKDLAYAEPIFLRSFRVVNTSKRLMRLLYCGGNGIQRSLSAEILLDAANANELLMWLEGFSEHIAFAESVLSPEELSDTGTHLLLQKPVEVPVAVVAGPSTGTVHPEPAVDPGDFKGYLRIEGKMLKSWKKKYFVVSRGVLRSFGTEQEAEKLVSSTKSWSAGMEVNGDTFSSFEPLALFSYEVSNPCKRMIKLSPTPDAWVELEVGGVQARQILLDAPDAKSFSCWMTVFAAHIAYAHANRLNQS